MSGIGVAVKDVVDGIVITAPCSGQSEKDLRVLGGRWFVLASNTDVRPTLSTPKQQRRQLGSAAGRMAAR